jgi:hypothetical protein
MEHLHTAQTNAVILLPLENLSERVIPMPVRGDNRCRVYELNAAARARAARKRVPASHPHGDPTDFTAA